MMTILKRWCTFSSAANKRSKIKSILLLLLLFFPVASAQESLPVLQTEIAQKNQNGPQYQLGDRIQLSVRVPLDLIQQLNSIILKNTNEAHPLDQQGWHLDSNPQIIDGSLRFIVSPLKSGKLTLPELWIMKDDVHPAAKTTPINIEVMELKANPGETPALLDTIDISLPFKFVVLAVLVVISLLLLLYYFYKRYWSKRVRTVAQNEIQVPPTPDHIIALRDLEMLYDQFSYSKENMKPIAFGVSQILKNFFSSRFKVDARESTTDEMLALLKSESIPELEIKKIRALYQNLDLIKFTKMSHHEQFQKSDYAEFKNQAKLLIETWAIKWNGAARCPPCPQNAHGETVLVRCAQ